MTRPFPIRPAQALFEPVHIGALQLANRLVMAPLTRNRAGPRLVPGPFAAEYYAQRATAGLIIAEATQVSAQAQGYADTDDPSFEGHHATPPGSAHDRTAA